MLIFSIQVPIFVLAIVPALLLIPLVTWNEVTRYQLRRAVTQFSAKRPGRLSAWVALVSVFLAMIGMTIALVSLMAGLTDVRGVGLDYMLLLALCILPVTKGIPFLVEQFLSRA